MTDTLSSQTDKPEFGSVNEVLHHIQRNLKAPKSNRNDFGKYNYRSAEDILEAVKPLLPDGATLIIHDEIKMIGERYYIQANVNLDYMGKRVHSQAFAREPIDKKGMDESQITGAASSYARKYALNGLFLIDDTKDADTMAPPEPKYSREDKITQVDLIDSIANITTPEGIDKWHQHYADTINQLPKEFQDTIEAQLNARLAQLENGIEPPLRVYRHVDVEHAKDYFDRFMAALPKMSEKAIVTRQATDEAKIASVEKMLGAAKYQVNGESPAVRLRKAMNDRMMELKGAAQ